MSYNLFDFFVVIIKYSDLLHVIIVIILMLLFLINILCKLFSIKLNYKINELNTFFIYKSVLSEGFRFCYIY